MSVLGHTRGRGPLNDELHDLRMLEAERAGAVDMDTARGRVVLYIDGFASVATERARRQMPWLDTANAYDVEVSEP